MASAWCSVQSDTSPGLVRCAYGRPKEVLAIGIPPSSPSPAWFWPLPLWYVTIMGGGAHFWMWQKFEKKETVKPRERFRREDLWLRCSHQPWGWRLGLKLLVCLHPVRAQLWTGGRVIYKGKALAPAESSLVPQVCPPHHAPIQSISLANNSADSAVRIMAPLVPPTLKKSQNHPWLENHKQQLARKRVPYPIPKV